MKRLFHHLVIITVFLLMLIVSLSGIATNNQFPKNINNLEVNAHKDGISLGYPEAGKYYTFSPYNDYYLDSNGRKNGLITQKQLLEKNFKSDFEKNIFKKIYITFLHYFNRYSPSITFSSDRNIGYQTSVNNNDLTLIRQIKGLQLDPDSLIGTTLTFNKDDLVFDNKSNIFYSPAQTDIDIINQAVEIFVTNTSKNEYKIFIINKNLPSYITIRFNENQKAFVNNQYNYIIVEQKPDIKNSVIYSQLDLSVDNLPADNKLSL